MDLFSTRPALYTVCKQVPQGTGSDAVISRSGRAIYVASPLYAEVTLDLPVKELADRLFTYEIPAGLVPDVFIGSQVLVPFGKQDLVCGWVVSLKEFNGDRDHKTKQIAEILDGEPLFNRRYIDFLYWIAGYYAATISDVLQAAIPRELVPRWRRLVSLTADKETTQLLELSLTQSQRAVLSELKQKPGPLSLKTLKDRSGLPSRQFYEALKTLKQEGVITIEKEMEGQTRVKTILSVLLTGQPGRTKRQCEILAVLSSQNGRMSLSELVKATGSTSATIRKMESEGLVVVTETETMRDPLAGQTASPVKPPTLTASQSKALEVLGKALEETLSGGSSPGDVPWLLFGVTGSGKTEVYMQLITRALESGRKAMLLVPEISLTPQLSQRLTSRFPGQVAVWHSSLSPGERFDTWRRIEQGELRVILGARSATLLRVEDLGLVILDEEHDSSYKQTSPAPRYSARHLAIERGKRESAFVLFGSATPDACTYSQCRQANKVVELPGRVTGGNLPESVIVDMRTEAGLGNRGIFSRLLLQEMSSTLEKQEQVILLVNRRGYSSHIFCKSCGHVLRCKHCSVSLVYHNYSGGNTPGDKLHLAATMASGRFMCHHCNFQKSASEICPSCDAPFLRQSGLGTQRVELETKERFPEAKILRLDSDVTSRKGAYEDVFNRFSRGEADILIGTQMIAKGIDIARVTLVGVLSADAVFNLPDYRSLERGFQLLTQVSGRAGRGDRPGRVILQTYNPELPALDLARKQDYNAFIEQELAGRIEFSYPPVSQLIRVVFSSEYPEAAEACAFEICESLAVHLEDAESTDNVRLVGPAPCLIEKIKNLHRWQLLIKNKDGEHGRAIVSTFLKTRRIPASVRIAIDVDPVDLV